MDKWTDPLVPAPNEPATSLESLLNRNWSLLEDAVHNRHHAFHTPALATISDLTASTRIVVLRGARAESRQLVCHTDVRSAKVAHLQQNPHIGWLFYDPVAKIQIRAEGLALVHHQDQITEFSWQRTPPSSRRCYLTLKPPGTPLDQPGTNLPPHLHDRAPDASESDQGWTCFAVIVATITRLEWLYLDAHGHQRAGWNWQDGAWQGSWLVP